MKSRVQISFWKGGVKHDHSQTVNRGYPQKCSECDCDLHCKIMLKEFESNNYFVSRRYVSGRKLEYTEMCERLGCMISSKWVLNKGKLSTRAVASAQAAAEIAISKIRSDNMIPLKPYFNYKGVPKSRVLKPDRDLIRYYKFYDVKFFNKLLHKMRTSEWYAKNIWLEVKVRQSVICPGLCQIGAQEVGVPSLTVLAMRSASIHNQVFGGDKDGPYAMYSMANLYPVKMPKLLKKFVTSSHMVNRYGRSLSSVTYRAMREMYRYMDLEKYKATKEFRWTRDLVDDVNPPQKTSSGIRPGPTNKVKKINESVRAVYSVSGKKMEHIERAKQKVIQFAETLLSGADEDTHIGDRVYAVVSKHEVFFSLNKQEREKYLSKIRQFYIQGITHYILSSVVQGYRQKVERGNVIRIGHNWWHGGAFNIAKWCHYASKEMVWYLADIKGFDTVIKMNYLLMYTTFAGYYYKRTGDYKLYQKLLRESGTNLAVKLVHLFGDIWTLMFGVMPSGAYETSHGDSWILTLMYFQYLIKCVDNHPEREDQIMECIRARMIAISVYGDDSIFAVPKNVADIVNIKGFTKFMQVYHDIQLKDIEVHETFLSVPDRATGGLKHEGVSFLQRYFVARETVTDRVDLPPVLPYRKFYKIYTKFAFGKGEVRTPMDYVLAAIGMAYDSHGTNDKAYEFASTMYKLNMQRVGMTFSEAMATYEFGEGDTALTRLCRKISIPLDELRRGFPTRNQLFDMHIDDGRGVKRMPVEPDEYV